MEGSPKGKRGALKTSPELAPLFHFCCFLGIPFYRQKYAFCWGPNSSQENRHILIENVRRVIPVGHRHLCVSFSVDVRSLAPIVALPGGPETSSRNNHFSCCFFLFFGGEGFDLIAWFLVGLNTYWACTSSYFLEQSLQEVSIVMFRAKKGTLCLSR